MRVFVLATLIAGCGTRSIVGDEPTAAKSAPLAVFARDERMCAAPSDVSAMGLRESDKLAVVSVTFADECTGAGGQHILGHEVDGFRDMWLGAHACRTWTTPPTAPFAVMRYSQTAALFRIPDGACIEPLTSDVQVKAVALFATRADAEAFAR